MLGIGPVMYGLMQCSCGGANTAISSQHTASLRIIVTEATAPSCAMANWSIQSYPVFVTNVIVTMHKMGQFKTFVTTQSFMQTAIIR